MTNEQITTIIVAVLGANGLLTTLIVGIFDLIKKKMDKKNGIQKELADIKAQMCKTDAKLDEHIAQSYRNKILDFQNSCMRNERHTYEQFTEVIEAIEKYEEYCEANNVNNHKCKLAIEYIEAIYKQCQTDSDFAPMGAQMINEAELRRIINNVNQVGN